MNYAEMLKHPKWQKRRLERLEAAGFTCSHCESKENTLHVHHTRYRRGRKLWDYSDDELVVLCEDCHEEVEHARDELLLVVGQLSVWGLNKMIGYAKAMVYEDNGVFMPLEDIEETVGAGGYFAGKICGHCLGPGDAADLLTHAKKRGITWTTEWLFYYMRDYRDNNK